MPLPSGSSKSIKNHVETRDFVANDGCEGFARRVDGLNPETGHHENPGERLSRDGTIVHDQYAGGRWYVAIPHSGGGQLPRRPFDGYRSFCHDGYASTLRLHCGVGCASSGWISRRAPARRPVTGIRVYLPERRCNPSNPAEHFYLHAIHFDQDVRAARGSVAGSPLGPR